MAIVDGTQLMRATPVRTETRAKSWKYTRKSLGEWRQGKQANVVHSAKWSMVSDLKRDLDRMSSHSAESPVWVLRTCFWHSSQKNYKAIKQMCQKLITPGTPRAID